MRVLYRVNFFTRIRSAWAVFRAKNYVVLEFDPNDPPNKLGELHLGAPIHGLPERMANATLVLHQYDAMDSEEGQHNALRRAREVLGLNQRRHDT